LHGFAFSFDFVSKYFTFVAFTIMGSLKVHNLIKIHDSFVS
jgi:hypothetical protein